MGGTTPYGVMDGGGNVVALEWIECGDIPKFCIHHRTVITGEPRVTDGPRPSNNGKRPTPNAYGSLSPGGQVI